MSNKFFIIYSLIIGWLCSCHKQPLSVSKADPDEINKFQVQQINFRYLSGKAKINFKDSENDINASAHIRIKKDSLIWISLVPALGIEVSRCLITTDSVFLLDRLNNQYFEYDFNSLARKINITLSYRIIESILLGNLAFPRKSTDSLSKDSASVYFILKQKERGLAIENFVKINTMKLEKLEIKEPRSHKELQMVYNNFAPLNEFLFAYNSLLNLIYQQRSGLQSTSISIEYNKVELDEKVLNFPFNVPAKFTREK